MKQIQVTFDSSVNAAVVMDWKYKRSNNVKHI